MKKWELHRRTLLRGAGASVALPLLEQMLPSVARAQAAGAPPPRRLLAFYVPCGMYMKQWTPATTGAGWASTPILKPLEDAGVKSDVLVLTGLANRPAEPDGAGHHGSGTGAFITAMHPFKTEGRNLRNGISLDQVAAQAFRAHTPYSSLQLGTNGDSNVGGCDSGYSCAYSRNISWSGPSTPLAKETQAHRLFDRLFPSSAVPETPEQTAKRKRYKQSVLDFVRADARALQGKLGRADKAKLEEYLTGVREVEMRLASSRGACVGGVRPTAGGNLETRTRNLLDVLVLALRCDLTRAATFMLENAGSEFTFSFLGLSGNHHSYSHHQELESNIGPLATIDHWEVAQFAYLLQEMKKIQEPDGTLLDNSAVYFSSEIEDGDTHSSFNLPVLVAGKAGGAFTTGRHVRFGNEPPVANLFVSLLQGVGVPVSQFGQDSTGPLGQLKV